MRILGNGTPLTNVCSQLKPEVTMLVLSTKSLGLAPQASSLPLRPPINPSASVLPRSDLRHRADARTSRGCSRARGRALWMLFWPTSSIGLGARFSWW